MNAKDTGLILKIKQGIEGQSLVLKDKRRRMNADSRPPVAENPVGPMVEGRLHQINTKQQKKTRLRNKFGPAGLERQMTEDG